MTRTIVWSERALKNAERLSPSARRRVISALERLAEADVGDVKKLAGPDPEWRLRVGEYRVRFRYEGDLEGNAIRVLRIAPRQSAYRD